MGFTETVMIGGIVMPKHERSPRQATVVDDGAKHAALLHESGPNRKPPASVRPTFSKAAKARALNLMKP